LDGVWTVLDSIGRSVLSEVLCCPDQTANQRSTGGIAQILDW
jgi:hypothetical protein